MASNSYMVTAELTIDLEPEGFEEPTTPTLPTSNEQRFLTRLSCKPITKDRIQFNVPESIEVGNLTKKAVNVLEEHLNIDQVGTMYNWEAVASNLGLTMDNITLMSNSKTTGLLHKCTSMPLCRLLDALLAINRIDTLFSLHMLEIEKRLYRGKAKPAAASSAPPLNYFQQATAQIATETYDAIVQPGGILIISFCGNSKDEKKDVKWLLKNMKNKNDGRKGLYSLDDVVADSNVEESAKDAFQKAEHVVFCLTPSLMHLLQNKDTSEHSIATRSVLYTSMLADQEFVYNKCKNFRFRAVIFESNPVDVGLVCWARATIQYPFPSAASKLFVKLGLVANV